MRDDDFARFQELMSRAADVTVMPNGKDLGRITLALFEGLRAWAFEDVAEAVAEHCRSERFFPMLADIVTHIEGSADDRAMMAWATVLKAVQTLGSECSVRFPDVRIHWAIQQMGGWLRLCRMLHDDNERFVARDFARWMSFADRAIAGGAVMPDYLVGGHERVNGYRRTVWDAETRLPIRGEAVPALAGRTGGDAAVTVRAVASRMRSVPR